MTRRQHLVIRLFALGIIVTLELLPRAPRAVRGTTVAAGPGPVAQAAQTAAPADVGAPIFAEIQPNAQRR